jgi:amidohydrolase
MMLQKAQQLAGQLSAWRREFHQMPELGFREQRTAVRIAEIQSGLGSRVQTGVARTGVVAELGHGSPVVAIRADMDALPIEERSDQPYRSQNPGCMHACGHDAHTAMALGAAALLVREQFQGTVRFLHQPSEEVGDDEGISGAPRMIDAGAMQGVALVLATHVDPTVAVGNISIAAGPFSGGVDSFFANIYGRGGHGAAPHETVDPIYIAGLVLVAVHGIVARRLNPFSPAVISVGTLRAGGAENVIPDQVDLTGTIRYMDEAVQHQIHAELDQILTIARTLGGDYKLKIETGIPPMINHPQAVTLIEAAAGRLLGTAHVLPPEKTLGAEDFGCFTRVAPGAMFALGCRIEDQPRQLHSPYFDLDEACLPVGSAILAESALWFLKAGGFHGDEE